MTMTLVEYLGGRGDLGRWGYIELTGARSATVHSRVWEDFELPEDVAADLTGSYAVLDSEAGRLIFFPLDIDQIHGYDINSSQPMFEPIGVDGEEDPRNRWRVVSVVEAAGALFVSEHELFFFNGALALAWIVRGDFYAWDLRSSDGYALTLGYADLSGRRESHRYRISDGLLVD